MTRAHAPITRALVAAFTLAITLLVATRAFAYAPPPNEGAVTDTAHKLTPEDIATLDHKLAGYRASAAGAEITVFLAGSLDGETIDDVAFATFNAWHLGAKDKANGVLLVIAPNERRVRIETGKGVEGDLPDLLVNDIIRGKISPRLRVNDFRGAIDAGTDAIYAALAHTPAAAAKPIAVERHWSFGQVIATIFVLFLFLGLPFLFIASIVSKVRRGGRRPGPYDDDRFGGGGGGFVGGYWGGGGGSSGGSGGGNDWGGGGDSGGGGGGDWGGGGDSGGGGSSDSY